MNYRYAIYFEGELVEKRITSTHRTVALVATSQTGICLMHERDYLKHLTEEVLPKMMDGASESRILRIHSKIETNLDRLRVIEGLLVDWGNLNAPKACEPFVVALYADRSEALTRQMREVKGGRCTEIVEVFDLTEVAVSGTFQMPGYDGNLIPAAE